ncbi:major facilitator superfamily domain-containing protein [Bipolaris maydis]|uniref:major facilitator superfamily domain-containing protein n=1 Tax=Cochliobolus heterostrophus TaxID=5016 RepID=UPI0024D62967|nr:major facilitator superfamily domain-containing protein [Bipolaris maydis]KAJ6273409.1 major facilitator superfamily domain-containing protein [Bipolaris maydis]
MSLRSKSLASDKEEHSVQAGNYGLTSAPTSPNANAKSDNPHVDEKSGAPRSIEITDSDHELAKIDTSAPKGVREIQAMTYSLSKKDLIAAYIMVWLIEFMLTWTSGTVGTLTPYITSSFREHSFTALTGVIASLVGGIWKLPYAKIMNIWGRPPALYLGVAFTTIGIVMMAACNSVKTYCAAQVFFTVGYRSIDFSLIVFISDTSKVKNRGFFLGYLGLPWLITTFLYGLTVDRIVSPGGIGLRWGFGILAILVPIVCLPLIGLLYINQAKEQKQGLIEPRPTPATSIQKLIHYGKEFDVAGLLILATGVAPFFLSFNLYSYQAERWKSPHLLKNRTVIFTYTMAATIYIASSSWSPYFHSSLIVLYNQTIVHATYVSNVYAMGASFTAIVSGVCLRYYGRVKMYSFFWGVPLTVLGTGLMIRFLHSDSNIGYIVMCYLFLSLGTGVLVTSEQTKLMAVSKQEDFPALLVYKSLTGVFPRRLLTNLPANALPDFAKIYGSLQVQAMYPIISPIRDAINLSYAQTQRYLLITATCINSLSLVSIAFWQDIDLKNQKQCTFGLL